KYRGRYNRWFRIEVNFLEKLMRIKENAGNWFKKRVETTYPCSTSSRKSWNYTPHASINVFDKSHRFFHLFLGFIKSSVSIYEIIMYKYSDLYCIFLRKHTFRVTDT